MDSQERQDGDVILEDLVLQGAGLLSRKVAPPAEINKDNRTFEGPNEAMMSWNKRLGKKWASLAEY